MINIKVTPEMGRGVYAERNLMNGDVIVCDILLLNPEDTKKVNETDLQFYTFRVNDLQDCLVLGIGELFNHADSPNVSYELVEYDGRMQMVFEVTKFIAKGEQLFINYAADAKVNVEKYVAKTSLIG